MKLLVQLCDLRTGWQVVKLTLVALVCIALQSCASSQLGSEPKQPEVVGTWEFVSGRYTPKGKPVIEVKTPQLRAQKIVTPTHFSYITETENGSFYVAGAGKCKVESGKYTETLDYASVANMKNKSYTFTYRIENNLWYMEGQEDDTYTEEVWRRVH